MNNKARQLERARQRQAAHGIEHADHLKLLHEQRYKCLTCERPVYLGSSLHADKSGVVLGALCARCFQVKSKIRSAPRNYVLNLVALLDRDITEDVACAPVAGADVVPNSEDV
jgi:hypothetical protein